MSISQIVEAVASSSYGPTVALFLLSTIVTIVTPVFSKSHKKSDLLSDIEIFKEWVDHGEVDTMRSLKNRIDSSLANIYDYGSLPFWESIAGSCAVGYFILAAVYLILRCTLEACVIAAIAAVCLAVFFVLYKISSIRKENRASRRLADSALSKDMKVFFSDFFEVAESDNYSADEVFNKALEIRKCEKYLVECLAGDDPLERVRLKKIVEESCGDSLISLLRKEKEQEKAGGRRSTHRSVDGARRSLFEREVNCIDDLVALVSEALSLTRFLRRFEVAKLIGDQSKRETEQLPVYVERLAELDESFERTMLHSHLYLHPTLLSQSTSFATNLSNCRQSWNTVMELASNSKALQENYETAIEATELVASNALTFIFSLSDYLKSAI